MHTTTKQEQQIKDRAKFSRNRLKTIKLVVQKIEVERNDARLKIEVAAEKRNLTIS